jgi:serine/threonine protein kinase
MQDQDVSNHIQLALNDCYDSDEDDNENADDNDIDDTLSFIETTSTGNGILGHISRDDKYQIDYDLLQFSHHFTDRIGIGGFGEVFRGTYKGEIVAVKEVDIYRNYQKVSTMPMDEFHSECNRVREETILLRHVCFHTNIVNVYGCYTPTTMTVRPVIVMELLDTALDQILHSNYMEGKWLPYTKRLQLLQGIISAVEFLHLQGIVHQDIKPSNILVDVNTMVAKLTDFGVAETKEFGTTMGHYCTTKKYITKLHPNETRVAQAGTHAYMSPEKIRSSIYKSSRKSDIYSLGVTIWEVTSNQKPPHPKSQFDLKQLHDMIQIKDSTMKVLLPFPISYNSTMTDSVPSVDKIQEMYSFSVLEMIAFACLLLDFTHRPNATQLTTNTNNSCSILLQSFDTKLGELDEKQLANLMYNEEDGIVCNPFLPDEIALFKVYEIQHTNIGTSTRTEKKVKEEQVQEVPKSNDTVVDDSMIRTVTELEIEKEMTLVVHEKEQEVGNDEENIIATIQQNSGNKKSWKQS